MTTTTHNTGRPASPDRPSPVTEHRDERMLLRSGVLVGILHLVAIAFFVVFFSTSHPAPDASPEEAAVGFRDAAVMVGVGTLLLLLPLPFSLLFLGGLSALFQRIAGGGLATASIHSGVVAFTVVAVGAVVSAVGPAIGAADASAAAGAVIKGLDGVMPLTLALAGIPRAILLVGAAILLRRAGLVGRATRVATYVIAALGVVGSLSFLSPAVFGAAGLALLLSVGWMTVLGVRLSRTTSG